MAYNSLNRETGSTDGERREEAARILKILDDCGVLDQLTPRESTFVEQMGEGGPVSPNQLFWLRDIKKKYAE